MQYQTESNEGRIYVDLTGKPVNGMPPAPSGYGQAWGGQHGGGKPQHHGQQQQYGGHQQQNNQNDEIEEVVKKVLPGVIRALKGCCIVM